MAALEELDRVHEAAKRDPTFWTELNALLKDYVGRPTPLTEAPRLGEQVGAGVGRPTRSEEHTSELQSHLNLVCRLLLEKQNKRRPPHRRRPAQRRRREQGHEAGGES